MAGIYIMRRSEDNISRAILNLKPLGKRLRGRTRRIWLDVIETLIKWEYKNEKNYRDRKKWRGIVMAAKTLTDSI